METDQRIVTETKQRAAHMREFHALSLSDRCMLSQKRMHWAESSHCITEN